MHTPCAGPQPVCMIGRVLDSEYYPIDHHIVIPDMLRNAMWG